MTDFTVSDGEKARCFPHCKVTQMALHDVRSWDGYPSLSGHSGHRPDPLPAQLVCFGVE